MPRWLRALFFAEQSAKTLNFVNGSTALSRNGQRISAPIELIHELSTEIRSNRNDTVNAMLPRSLFLKREISIPAKGSGKLNEIASLDLRRSTPFSADELCWALSMPRREGNRLVADQWVIKRIDLERIERILRGIGFSVASFGVEEVPKGPMLPALGSATAARAKIWRTVNGVLVGLAITLGFWIWLSPTLRDAQALRLLEDHADSLQADALALRQDVEALRLRDEERGAFLSLIVQRPRVVERLRQMTISVPDEAWVSEMTFTPEFITFSGQTTETAAGLVLELSGTRNFENPRLSGPVSRASDGAEIFEISIDLGATQ